MKKCIIFIGLCCVHFNSLQAQIQLSLSPPSSENLNPTSCWNATIINLSSQNLTIHLTGSIKNQDNQEVVNLRSQSFFLRPGTNRIMPDQVLSAGIDYRDNAVKKSVMNTGNLPSGEYEICTSVIVSGGMEETMDCKLTNYVNRGNEVTSKAADGKKWTRHIDFYGRGSVEHFYSNRQGTDQVIPSDYTRLDIQASAAVKNIPFTLSAFYTTEENSMRPDINAITFSFDSDHFKETLRNLVTQQAIALAEQQSRELMNKFAKLEELDKLTRIVNDGALLQELDQLQNLETSLNRLRDELNTGNLESSARSLKLQELEQLESQAASLRAKKLQYDKLKQRVQSLLKFKEDLEASGALEGLDQLDINKLRDPALLKGELEKYGLFKGSNKFLFGIRNLAIGTAFPFYSPLTINGIKVDGGLVELNPGIFYLNFTMGNTRSSIYNPATNELLNFSSRVMAGKIGVGAPEGNHFHLMGMEFKDQDNQFVESPDPEALHPESNYVFGADFGLAIADKKVRLDGEVAFSSYDKNVLAEDPIELEGDYDFLPGFMQPTTSNGVDVAYDLGLQFNLAQGNTRIKLDSRYIGPGYFSFGAPNLRTDLQRFAVRLDQYLLKRKLQFTAHYRADRDNLFETRGLKTDNTMAGAGINFRTRNAPYIRVSYELNNQDNEFRKFKINNYHLLTGHSYKTGTWHASTSLNLNYIANSNDSILGQYNANYASLTQSFTTPSMVNLSLGLNRSETEISSNTTEILGGEISAGFRIARIVRFNIGGSYFLQSVESADDQSRYGGNAMISIPFLRVFQLSVDARYNSFDSVIDPLLGFEDFYVRTILSANW